MTGKMMLLWTKRDEIHQPHYEKKVREFQEDGSTEKKFRQLIYREFAETQRDQVSNHN